MNKLKELLLRYDTAIWVRVFGTMLTTTTGFMLRPFLVLYLYDKLGGSVLLPMVIVGLQPLMGILISLWGGGMTDRYGRKPLMLIALVIEALSMTGFVYAQSVWEFAALTILNGLGMALFYPAANAQIADIIPEEQRAEIFALLHTALNVGAAVGPLLGFIVFTKDPSFVFGISAVAFVIYALVVWWKVPETMPVKEKHEHSAVRQSQPFRIADHKTLFLITFFAIPVSLLYAQTEATLPLHLKTYFANYQSVLVTLMTINGAVVILLQLWIAKRTEKLNPAKVILVSYLLFAIVSYGYGWLPVLSLLIVNEVLFTIGEMMNGPHIQKAVSLLAPSEMRGRYFSIFGMSWQISKAVGPLLGGVLMTKFGGAVMFSCIGLLLFLSGMAQYRILNSVEKKRVQTSSDNVAVSN
ncbi:MDR family MFS transporter [Brevibacillus ginsengisoli]|uniref:MDR family MFS transporter n=1 Tax=Brevibacillus ginsengisoli TaxID=363854 RepID=UPI003CF07796